MEERLRTPIEQVEVSNRTGERWPSLDFAMPGVVVLKPSSLNCLFGDWCWRVGVCERARVFASASREKRWKRRAKEGRAKNPGQLIQTISAVVYQIGQSIEGGVWGICVFKVDCRMSFGKKWNHISKASGHQEGPRQQLKSYERARCKFTKMLFKWMNG